MRFSTEVVELEASDRSIYVEDAFDLVRWGSAGLERLALWILPKPPSPSPDPTQGEAELLSGDFWLLRSPRRRDFGVRVILSGDRPLGVQVLTHEGPFARVRIDASSLVLEGWIDQDMLAQPGTGYGMSASGSSLAFPTPYFEREPRIERSEDEVDVPMAVRLGSPLFAGPGTAEVIMSYALERTVTGRLRAQDDRVELVGFPNGFEPIAIRSGRVYVNRQDVLLGAVRGPGIVVSGRNPFAPSERGWRIEELSGALFRDVFRVGDELIELREGGTRWTYTPTDAVGLDVGLRFLAPLHFLSRAGVELPSRTREVSVWREGVRAESSLAYADCGSGAFCNDGFVRYLERRCTFHGVWRCQDE